MSGALLGSLSCSRCAQILPADDLFCTTCGARQDPAASGGALSQTGGLLAGVVQATGSRKQGALAIDAAAVVVGAAILAGATIGLRIAPGAASPHGRPTAGPLAGPIVGAAVLGALIVAAVLVVAVGSTGRTLGMRVLELRHVDNLTALPPGPVRALVRSIARWRPRSTLTADLRRGRDPLSPAHAPTILAEHAVGSVHSESSAQEPPAALTSAGDTPRRRRHGARAAAVDPAGPVFASVRLVFDSGDEVTIDKPLIVGRNPESDAGGTAVHALPDLSRSLSRTHALLDWRDGLLWVTDLNTTNGSAVVDADGGVRPLVPGLRTAASIGWRVEIGERSIEVLPGVPA